MASNPLRYRMAIALLALVAGLVALYLHLWKEGLAGTLACTGNQGCQIAMLSRWGWFTIAGRRTDVALIGAVGYTLLTGVALWSLRPRWAHSPVAALALLGLIVPAVLFTARLKYGEWIVLRTFCVWCLESMVTILLCLVLALLDWHRVRTSRRSVTSRRAGTESST